MANFGKNFIKRITYSTIGLATYPGINIFNKLRWKGTEHLKNLPNKNVLFVSNHQTYFADVICFLQIFAAVKNQRKGKLGIPFYLMNPHINVNFVAAEETMQRSFLSRIFKLAGAVTVKRSWRADGENVQRGLDVDATEKITEALKSGWLINFPQGTTKAFAEGRKGTGYLIKENQPIVVPVTINGFRRAFDKTGLKMKKRGTLLNIEFHAPLSINFEDSPAVILAQVMSAIGQEEHHKFSIQ
jgi:1-acyl-sn-glycerol-3-phosphate acyltransferase